LRNLFAENTIERISPFQKLMKEDSITWKLPGVSYHSTSGKKIGIKYYINNFHIKRYKSM